MLISRSLSVFTLAACGFLPCLLAATRVKDRRVLCNLGVSSIISIAGFFVTARIIPVLKPVMLRANLFGMDINKKGESTFRQMAAHGFRPFIYAKSILLIPGSTPNSVHAG